MYLLCTVCPRQQCGVATRVGLHSQRMSLVESRGQDGMELAGPAFLNIHVCPASVLVRKQSCCSMTGPILDHFGRSISLACVPIHPVTRVAVLQVSASVARQSRKVRARGKEGGKKTKGRLVLRDTWWTEAVCGSISLLHRSSAIYSLETV